MDLSWEGITSFVDRLAPAGSPRRKLLQIVAVILIFEGISVLLLFSYQGAVVGILSLAIGLLLMMLIYERAPEVLERREEETLGMKLVGAAVRAVGGEFVLAAIGVALILAVVAFNRATSARPELGDLDTLVILLGGMMVLYPFAVAKFRVEAVFSLVFLALVVLFLVVPQVVMASAEGTGSTVGTWYVRYMLAAPFAGILNLLGIDAVSTGNMVTMQFQDGTLQTLGISAYCAGLYSFSIFLSAFLSFVLVFERLPRRVLAAVLGLGLLIAYLGNLFRMVVIGVVGYYRGLDDLLWAHENAGWIIFLGWSVVFWYLLLNYVGRVKRQPSGMTEAN